MTDSELATVVGAVPVTIASIAGLIVALRTSNKVDTVHQQINSRMDELLSETSQNSATQAVATERADVAAKAKL